MHYCGRLWFEWKFESQARGTPVVEGTPQIKDPPFVIGEERKESSPFNSWPKAPSISGKEYGLPVSLGRGIQSVPHDMPWNCVELGPLVSDKDAQGAEYKLIEITSISQLRNHLNVYDGALLKGRSSSSRVEYVDSVFIHSYSKYFFVGVRVTTDLELATSSKFAPNAIQLITENQWERFSSGCGDRYVYGQRWGAN